MTFENLLAKPDAEYEIAFRLFDENGTGNIKYEDFQKLYNTNKGEATIPFDWNCEWASLYIGGRKHRHDMTYPQFSQMLRGLQGERIRQAFHIFDKDKDGYIEPEDFQRIILETARHKLSDHLLDNLHTLCNISTGSKISYANVRAFQNVIREMDLVDLIIRNATQKSEDGTITRTDFLNEAARITRFSLFTPMEADILFHFAGLDAPSGRLSLQDFAKVVDSSWQSAFALGLETTAGAAAKAVSLTQKIIHKSLESAHHFALGSLAGAFGAFVVYPIDLVKTRMQNQRSGRVGEMLYKNSIDCARKVIKNEGFRGLYSGVLPQLVGVAPEKAIKLTVNDLIRGQFTDKDTNKIWWPHEILAGGSAGACQVVRVFQFNLASEISNLTIIGLHQPLGDCQDQITSSRGGRQDRRGRSPTIGHVDRQELGPSRSLQRSKRMPSPRCALFRHLLPSLQPLKTRPVWRRANQETRCPPTPHRWRHCRDAGRLPHDALRRDQDAPAGGSPQGGDEIYVSPALRRDGLPGRRNEGFLQGWSCESAQIVAAVRVHPGGL